MKIEFDLINDIPYLSIKDGETVVKSDIVVSKDHLVILHEYYHSLLGSVDEFGDLKIPKEDIIHIAEYAAKELWL